MPAPRTLRNPRAVTPARFSVDWWIGLTGSILGFVTVGYFAAHLLIAWAK